MSVQEDNDDDDDDDDDDEEEEEEEERLKGFRFRTFIGHFQVTTWQCRG